MSIEDLQRMAEIVTPKKLRDMSRFLKELERKFGKNKNGNDEALISVAMRELLLDRLPFHGEESYAQVWESVCDQFNLPTGINESARYRWLRNRIARTFLFDVGKAIATVDPVFLPAALDDILLSNEIGDVENEVDALRVELKAQGEQLDELNERVATLEGNQ
ncbi:MAG: hypothetical protein ACRD3E_00815 [Terriglobales bacterium]